MEHLHHFGLAEDPFRNEPLARFLFETPPQADALRRLDRGVRQGRGLCVLTGEVGSGKSVVVRQLFESLEEEVFEASMLVIVQGAVDSTWVLHRYARQLGIEDPPAEREVLVAALYDRLAIVREDGRHAVLIIDGAQALTARDTLADVCSLLQLEYEERRLLTLVLAGSNRLERGLARDAALSRRVDVRTQLAPLDREATRHYVGQRVARAGGNPAIVSDEAVAALHELAQGSPGLVNVLGDNALYEAFLAGRPAVSRADVERAHADLRWPPADADAASAVAHALGAGEHAAAAMSGDDVGIALRSVAPKPDPAEAEHGLGGPSRGLGEPPASRTAESPFGPPLETDDDASAASASPGDSFHVRASGGGAPPDAARPAGPVPHGPPAPAQGRPTFAPPHATTAVEGAALGDIDSELEAVFEQSAAEPAAPPAARPPMPAAPAPAGGSAAFVTNPDLGVAPAPAGGAGQGEEMDDLFVELVEE